MSNILDLYIKLYRNHYGNALLLWTLTWAKHISGNVTRGRRRKSLRRQQGLRIMTSWLQASSAGTPD